MSCLGSRVGCADLFPENIPALRTLVAPFQGLVTVEASSPTVRLMRLALEEHLRASLVLSAGNENEGLGEMQFILTLIQTFMADLRLYRWTAMDAKQY